MIDDEQERVRVDGAPDGSAYLYDFFKYLTSLSLLTLAGIFAISQVEGAIEQVGKRSLIAIMAAVALGGICSFMGVARLVEDKLKGSHSPRRLTMLRTGGVVFYSLGVGGFTMMFLDVVS